MASRRATRSRTAASSCSRAPGTTPSTRTPSASSPCCGTSWRRRRPRTTTGGHPAAAARGRARVNGDLAPGLRGVSHAWAFWCALIAGSLLALYAPSGTARAAALVYGGGLCALFAASGLYHRWRWNPRWRPLLRRIDHSTIYVFIAASYTPVALLVLFAAGGLLYSIGAAVYALRRPNPWPRTFGFHEVFHALVILAAAAHYVAMAGWVIPAG